VELPDIYLDFNIAALTPAAVEGPARDRGVELIRKYGKSPTLPEAGSPDPEAL
jgi:hypothetical protein